MQKRTKIGICLAVSVFLAAMTGTALGQVIYVDADASGANDGSSWTDAFNHLQDALAIASSRDEIRVAAVCVDVKHGGARRLANGGAQVQRSAMRGAYLVNRSKLKAKSVKP